MDIHQREPHPGCGHGHGLFRRGGAPGAPRGERHPIAVELLDHLPFTVGAAVVSMFAAYYLSIMLDDGGLRWRVGARFGDLFHITHPAHLLFSAAATTAMFLTWDQRVWRAVLVGIAGSAGICSVSDIFLPYLGMEMLGVEARLHVCLIDHPQLEAPFTIGGVLLGIAAARRVRRSTIYSHSAHVVVSCLATVFYLFSYAVMAPGAAAADLFQPGRLFGLFVIVVVAVLLPCCVSDVVFPLLFVRRAASNASAGSGTTERAAGTAQAKEENVKTDAPGAEVRDRGLTTGPGG
ncbi:MAG: hypothetical protein HY719_05090 [Planctomycetes bacterium]|nr:hypothetical protein [Planctomycetota bacterium]